MMVNSKAMLMFSGVVGDGVHENIFWPDLPYEVAVIGVDSLGFDVRVCSGRQVQTLRFAFKKRASSEYSAERQLNNLLFPRIPGKQQKQKETYQTEL
ncbi:hypothetical protein L1987_35503 [Smallanthus sonchifolius]|uniref:Uncharacterized protein n=1 Tax=Smallanthus sonchifolius TaxID=185202 RepID=A0ACB9HXY6_9ASTR|nr:hypothetical protein L1987_35503 [Smallanthus sonchifolius]